ncbi:MAG: poly-gamma-glutamate synthase PgsB [Flavobacteriales bacterium]|nr:poly-gamma-glutamate synthase PgsB [Flavobacteriales bacterium]
MQSLTIITLITIVLVLYLLLEYLRHQKALATIPHRIHVNGTRGKSSVTRLIGAGLRAGGIPSITKVTGTYPRMILPDGSEVSIHRKEKANILEQLNIVKYCSTHKAEVLIIECMALQPEYQRITEKQMIKATMGVITNIRMDHLDVMGPTLDDVAVAICNTIPKNTKLFTAEDRYTNYIKGVASKNNCTVNVSRPAQVSDHDMEGFSYLEHKENVALALNVCAEFGVSKDRALSEMHVCLPDEGVLRKFSVEQDGKRIHFFNALAANDPESSLIIWNSVIDKCGPDEFKIAVLNNRKDRQDRAVRLVEMVSKLEFDLLVLIGEAVEMVESMCRSISIPKDKLLSIGLKPTDEQFRMLMNASAKSTTIVAFGNMGAGGAELSKMFENQHNHQLKGLRG